MEAEESGGVRVSNLLLLLLPVSFLLSGGFEKEKGMKRLFFLHRSSKGRGNERSSSVRPSSTSTHGWHVCALEREGGGGFCRYPHVDGRNRPAGAARQRGRSGRPSVLPPKAKCIRTYVRVPTPSSSSFLNEQFSCCCVRLIFLFFPSLPTIGGRRENPAEEEGRLVGGGRYTHPRVPNQRTMERKGGEGGTQKGDFVRPSLASVRLERAPPITSHVCALRATEIGGARTYGQQSA